LEKEWIIPGADLIQEPAKPEILLRISAKAMFLFNASACPIAIIFLRPSCDIRQHLIFGYSQVYHYSG
jgi:hypothetical protein